MTDDKRKMYLKAGAIGIVSLFVLDHVIISPFIASWSDQSDRIGVLEQKVDRGQKLLDREDAIRQHWAGMQKANLPSEVSAAESQAFQAIGRWAMASGVNFASLAPNWQRDHETDGYVTFECRATATGNQAQISRFIYELETDPIPVSLNEFEVATRDEHGQLLTMTARFSFLQMSVDTKGGR